MSAEADFEREEETAPGKGPALKLRRDHTLLEMLAEGFRRLASALGEGGKVDPQRVREGIAVHRAFLVEIHPRKGQILDRELAKLPKRPFEAAEADRTREHETAQKATRTFEEELGNLERGEAAALGRLRDALRAEGYRFMRRARHQEEEICAKTHGNLPEAVGESVGHEIQKIRATCGAVEERPTSWTSSRGPASD